MSLWRQKISQIKWIKLDWQRIQWEESLYFGLSENLSEESFKQRPESEKNPALQSLENNILDEGMTEKSCNELYTLDGR